MWSVREKGGYFLPTQGLRCAVTPVTQLQRGIYGRDVRKRPAAHAGPVKTFAQDHMKTHVQSPDMIQQRNDILHNLPWRQWTKESLNLSARVDRGWWDVSKPPLLFHHKLFPIGLTQSRMDLFSAPNLFSLSWIHGYHPLYLSLAPLPLLPISFCVFCFKLLFCFALFCLCFLFGFFCNPSFSLFSSPSLTACAKRSHDLMHDSGHAGLKWLKVWHD